MRIAAVCAALFIACSAAARAADGQAFWGVFAETKSQKMAGMPGMPPELKEMDPKMLESMPGMSEMMAMFAPQRALTIRLWSPGIAPEGATASVAVPAGLKQGPKLDLELYRPKPESGTTGEGSAPGEFDPDKIPEFTIKRYWGSSETVKPGQPQIISWGKLTPEQARLMKEAARKAQKGQGGDYFYKPDWTTAYWPTKKQPGKIAADAKLPGNYALTTSYTGSIAIDVPANVDFPAAIEMTSPDLSEPPPFDSFIRFEWQPIPNLLGSHASIMGMEGKNTLVQWTSSEVPDEFETMDAFLQMAQVRDYVKKTIFMAGDRTSVTVPSGIFKDCDFVNMTMVGYGPGAALDKGQPLPRVQTKTTLTIMLGGKEMPKGGMGMGMGE